MEKKLKNIQTFEQYTDGNLNDSDVNDSLIGKIVMFNGEECEIIHRYIDKFILRSLKKYIKIEGSEPVHNFYKADIKELN